MPATERIRDIIQRWFLAEPLLFAAWTTHELVSRSQIKSIRTGRGKVEFNPAFINNLTDEMLAEVMRFEAVRIILKHPYERKKQHIDAAWQASNIAIQECIQSPLKMPRAREAFGTEAYDRKFYEFYYGLILERQSNQSEESNSDEDEDEETEKDSETSPENDASEEKFDSDAGGDNKGDDGQGNAPDSNLRQPETTVEPYFRPDDVAAENTETWDQDEMLSDKIDDVIEEIQATQNWGTLAGQAQELIEATLKPRLDYRRVLHAFRASVISMRRRLTRMKPSRRYGFQFMGSKREFSTRLLFAIDVSGSVSSEDVTRAFSIVNRFFKYGIEQVDVIWFDSEIRCEEPLQLKKAARRVKVHGRGGTKFQPVIDYLDDHREYEGLIVFTDGIAPAPKRTGKNRSARVVWLFNTEDNWKRIHKNLEGPGMWSAFVEAD
ncbi:VWA-like domain-containing protein [Verrucomicrobiales bacterium]|nr:VWA-like domain-containing protein [Verrucomicrobiales bacterium]